MNVARQQATRTLVAFRLAFAIALSVALSGCANPNFIGVQDFGYVVGNVVDSSGKPIANALVTVTGTTNGGSGYSGANGGFSIQNVAAGEQTITVSAVGYASPAPVTVIVVKDQGVQAGNIVLASVLPPT